MGPLTMAGRAYGLECVLDIQARAKMDLINTQEEMRIREMWALDIWPRKWSSDDASATMIVPALSRTTNNRIIEQPLLIGDI